MSIDELKISVAAVLGSLIVLVLGATLRVRRIGRRDPGRGVIYAFWHGRLLIPLFTHRGRGISILVSQHRDGEIISRVTRILGYDPVRGSTTRGGARALRQMIRRARDGRCLAVTPDGPRGPRHVFQSGTVKLAQLTGYPILPVGIGVDRKKELSSWDRFTIPLPFSRCVYVYGNPMPIKETDDPESAAALAAERLESLTAEADQYFVRR
jgi:lysophospholipid acyltransferase (LPLAT)-like uncharacterized protein